MSFFQAQDLSRDLTRKEVKQRANEMVEGLVAKTCTSFWLTAGTAHPSVLVSAMSEWECGDAVFNFFLIQH